MRLMGLDYGDRTIGVAISDEMGWTAQGLEVIRRKSKTDDLERIRSIIQQYDIGGIVVGLPRNMNGSIGPRAILCQEFAQSLEAETGLSVQLWDERLSTVAAERTLLEADMSRKKRKQVIDKMAAALILQGYLDSNQS